MTQAICFMPNCGRPAPADDPFCSKHRDKISMMDNKTSPKVEFNLSPPTLQSLLPGWSDDRLRQAYALIDAVIDGLSGEDDACRLLRQAADAVENADCELEGRS